MAIRLREKFPSATDGEIQHACNLISNELRKARYDIYEVILHTHCMASEPGNHADFDVTFGSGEYTVYVQLIVD